MNTNGDMRLVATVEPQGAGAIVVLAPAESEDCLSGSRALRSAALRVWAQIEAFIGRQYPELNHDVVIDAYLTFPGGPLRQAIFVAPDRSYRLELLGERIMEVAQAAVDALE